MIAFIVFFFAGQAIGTSAFQLKEPYGNKDNLIKVIEIIVQKIAEQSECMVFISDPYYRRLMNTGHVFLDWLPVFDIGLRDNDNFSPPRRRLEAALRGMKTAGCNSYIITIANGLLASRFLQYVENERLVNTNGYFLLLHDERLFRPELRYIWSRIINVIFLRRYGINEIRSGQKSNRDKIILETVHFPLRGGKFTTVRYLDTWYRGKFERDTDLYAQKTTNLKKRSLRVAVFEHIPAVTEESRKYYNWPTNTSTAALGIEFELMRTIATSMNFKADYYKPLNVSTERWGSPQGNNTYNGIIGEALSCNATFFLADLHYTLHHLKYLDLTVPYNTECLTFLTPESLTENSWKLLILPFKLYTWIALLFTLFLGGATMHVFALLYKNYITVSIDSPVECRELVRYEEPKGPVAKVKASDRMKGLYLFSEAQNSILYIYSMLLLVSLPTLPNAWAIRIFIGWWWIYSILVAVAYRASMTATLANPVARVTIDTIVQLAKTSIEIGGWSAESKEFFLKSPDTDSQKIGARFDIVNDEDKAIEHVANGTFCYFENIYFLRHARVKRQVLEEMEQANNSNKYESLVDAKRNLHIMEECTINMPIAIGMEKNSPLKSHTDILVRRLIEAGLVEKWLSDVMEWSKITEIRQETGSEKALINLHKLHGALVALGIGYFLSLTALATEILHWKYIVLKNPNYDKYRLDTFYKSG